MGFAFFITRIDGDDTNFIVVRIETFFIQLNQAFFINLYTKFFFNKN